MTAYTAPASSIASFGDEFADPGPHDDYVYAARVDRQFYALVTARTVVIVGVFHRYRRFGAHDQMVFDSYRAWCSPDGDIRVSRLRE